LRDLLLWYAKEGRDDRVQRDRERKGEQKTPSAVSGEARYDG
jgi:hypothetical protein